MRLSQRIADAGLSPAVARTFADGLLEVAGVDGEPDGDEAALIAKLLGDIVGSQGAVAAEFEALWTHAELFLTACLYIAVIDGNYGIEEARRLSEFAHRLGFSAHQLAALESRVFRELQERGAEARQREVQAAAAGNPAPLEAPSAPLASLAEQPFDDVTEVSS